MAFHDKYLPDNTRLGSFSSDQGGESDFQGGHTCLHPSNYTLQFGGLCFYHVIPPDSKNESFISHFLFNIDTPRSELFITKLYTLYMAKI